ncbi:hypothetical protein TSUD_54750 [Trifolium subterraneum]|uniref:Uncharacterized protein n=1 Tax=Trifolium subterraneum TaxID=3900 RepID=A0A2Z6MEH3_TRISU|nr:hypothetical protein TSUD_54750 [Trifolium subterraneum]
MLHFTSAAAGLFQHTKLQSVVVFLSCLPTAAVCILLAQICCNCNRASRAKCTEPFSFSKCTVMS